MSDFKLGQKFVDWATRDDLPDVSVIGSDIGSNEPLPTKEDFREAYKFLYIKTMTDVGVNAEFAAATFEAGGEPDYSILPEDAAQNEMDCWDE